MHLRPRNPRRDRLVNEPLAAYSYFQIGKLCLWPRLQSPGSAHLPRASRLGLWGWVGPCPNLFEVASLVLVYNVNPAVAGSMPWSFGVLSACFLYFESRDPTLCVCLLYLSPSLFPHSRVSPSPGAIQSFAGFADYFTAMAQEGWFPLLCVGLRPQWEDHHLQDLQDSYGQEWVSSACRSLPTSSSLVPCTFVGTVQLEECLVPTPSMVTVERSLSLSILGSAFCF